MTDKQSTNQAQNYSTVTFFEIEKSLRQPNPSWLLTPHGIVVAANVQAFWLWDADEPSDILGVNAFDILSRNLGRIPIEDNVRFFQSKTAQVKLLAETFGSGFYTAFIEAMQRDPYLRKIYVEQQKLSRQERWSNGQLQYTLQITLARSSGTLLKFQVTLSSLYGKLGYLATCLPYDDCRDTETLVQEEKSRVGRYSKEYRYLICSSKESHACVLRILLHLLHTEPETENSVPDQLLWGLAVVKVIEEGLTRDEKDVFWEPRSAFQRIRTVLKSEFYLFVEDERSAIIQDIRETIAKLHFASYLDKKYILALLYTFTLERKNTLQVSSFFHEELRIEKAAQRHVVAVEEPEEALQFDRVFQEAFRGVMTTMLTTKDDATVLTCFRRAYEYRRGFPWLPESRTTPDVIGQDGLSYALRSALVGYIVCAPEEAEQKAMSAVAYAAAEQWSQYADSEWTTSLLAAISATIDEAFDLERFENHLLRAHVDIAPSAFETVRIHIAAALVSYYERRKTSISADPF